MEAKIGSHYNCYKLFGFDVMFDDKLKPWMIEVNNIPSLFTNTIDSFVNRPMIQVGYTFHEFLELTYQYDFRKC